MFNNQKKNILIDINKYFIDISVNNIDINTLPVTGFPLGSVTTTDCTCSVTGLPLASESIWMQLQRLTQTLNLLILHFLYKLTF